jgi:YgiT-type zinc finger domain-containing protein
MISTTELSMANEIAHGGMGGFALSFYCENCRSQLFRVLEMKEKSGNRHQDIIIEKTYYLVCQRCGSEQMEHVLTIVPSWSGPCIDRDALPEWEGEE